MSVTVVGIAGSLREKSYNLSLLHAVANCAPPNCRVTVVQPKEIPFYNNDLEDGRGIPQPVEALKQMITDADGLILASPEYNHSISGVIKNVIDWLSRPPSDIKRVFIDRPVAIMGATPGRFGTAFAQTAWLPIISGLKMRPYFGHSVFLAGADALFDSRGDLVDDKARANVAAFAEGFSAFIRRG